MILPPMILPEILVRIPSTGCLVCNKGFQQAENGNACLPIISKHWKPDDPAGINFSKHWKPIMRVYLFSPSPVKIWVQMFHALENVDVGDV
jgi:hypothetical protein